MIPFDAFAAEKTRAAESAVIHPLVTLTADPADAHIQVGNDWTRAAYGGGFDLPASADDSVPVVSLVFVRSREGNTVAEDPGELGGGDTDAHLIYEGLSRVAADAVMAGAAPVTSSRSAPTHLR